MVSVKILKSKSYFKRYQVKFRRRRKNLTDYQQRRRLITQEKHKYNSKKYRFVVRITNRDIVCQIVAATVTKDVVLCSAYSHELKGHGLKVGFTNYAAAYATGLLLARRLLKQFKMDTIYTGAEEVNGEDVVNAMDQIEDWGDQEQRNAFRCYLDIGLSRSTTGARIFGALKGAIDGGLDIPYKDKRFPGSVKGDDDDEAGYMGNPEVHRKYIFGGHVGDYMRTLEEENPDKLAKQFSLYIKEGIGADDLEDMYHMVHASIRENPDRPPPKQRDIKSLKTYMRAKKRTLEDRKKAVIAKIEAAKAAMEADDE